MNVCRCPPPDDPVHVLVKADFIQAATVRMKHLIPECRQGLRPLQSALPAKFARSADARMSVTGTPA